MGTQVPTAGSQVKSAGSHLAVPPHTPLVHLSLFVQRLLSLQVVPSAAAVCAAHRPVAGTQAPATWQESVAGGQVTGFEPTQVPLASQAPLWLQELPLPLLQDVPEGARVCAEHWPLCGLQLPATWQASEAGGQVTGAPATQVPEPLQ